VADLTEQITLCKNCEADYKSAGIKIRLDASVKNRDRCEYCGKLGMAFLIKRKKVPKKKQP
jgi:hypothetical protein